MFEYGKSLCVDRRLVEDDITGSLAWAEALARAGVLRPPTCAAIASGLEAVRTAVRADPALIRSRLKTRTSTAFVERELVERIGDAGSDCIRADRVTSRCRSTSACT